MNRGFKLSSAEASGPPKEASIGASPMAFRELPGPEFWAFLIVLLMLILCYLPAVTSSFGYADDFPQLAESTNGVKWVQDAWTKAGRPIGGLLTEFSFRVARTIPGLALLRGLGLVLMLIIAAMMYVELKRCFKLPIRAALGAVFICSLPPFQVYVGWASMWLYLIPPVLTYLAYWLLVRAEGASIRLQVLFSVVSAVIVLVSLNIYPPSTMFLWFWFGVGVFAPEIGIRRILLRFMRVLVACGFGCVSYYVIYKLLGYSDPRSQLSMEFGKKMRWFVIDVLGTASHLQWFDSRTIWVPVAAWTIILVGFLVVCRSSRTRWIGGIVLSVALLPLCYLPILVVQEFEVSFRSQIALASFIGFLVCFGATNIVRAASRWQRTGVGVLALIVAAGLVKGNINLVSNIVAPQSFEYLYLKSNVVNGLRSGRKIAVIEGDLGAWLSHRKWNEFSLITTVMPSEYHMLGAMARVIARDASAEAGVPGTGYRLDILSRSQRPAADSYIVDMDAFAKMLP